MPTKFSDLAAAGAITGTEVVPLLQGGANVQSTVAAIGADGIAAAASVAAHIADTSDAHDASAISVDSTTLVGTGTDVQAVLEELDDAIAALGGIAQNSQSADYTLVAADANKHILHPSADTTARVFTIPANGSVAFAIGTAVTFVNQNAGGVITIAITTDTMRLAGAGTTGSRTLAANGIATALKITSTEWIVSGTGLT
jgi:hypothetical protein